MTQDNLLLQQTVSILTDKSRLKMLGLLSFQSYSLEELAVLLDRRASKVARHLRKLQHLGLIEVQNEKADSISRYTLNMQSYSRLKTSWYASQDSLSVSDEITFDESIFDASEQEIIRRFFVGTRLRAIPAGRKSLEIIVKWFAHLFEIDVCYQEKEVNEIIQRHYHDYAFFKKDLVGRGYLRRDHGVFLRVGPTWVTS